MHSSSGNCVAIGCAVVCYAKTAHIFSAGIKCRHSIYPSKEESEQLDQIKILVHMFAILNSEKNWTKDKYRSLRSMKVPRQYNVVCNPIFQKILNALISNAKIVIYGGSWAYTCDL